MTAEEWADGLREVVDETLHVDFEGGARFKARWVQQPIGSGTVGVDITMMTLSPGNKWRRSFVVSGDVMAHIAVPQAPAPWLWERMADMWGEVFTATFVVVKRGSQRRPEVADDR